VAAQLVGAVEQLGRQQGETSIGLWITPGNDAAERFYERLGYRHTGACKPAPKDPHIAMRRMRRDLRPATPWFPPDAATRLLPPPAHP
jgi:hypothetical protein